MPTAYEQAFDKLVNNLLLLAGSALLAGVAIVRLWSIPTVRKRTEGINEEALREARNDDEAPAKAETLLNQAVEALRPPMAEAAMSLLTAALKK